MDEKQIAKDMTANEYLSKHLIYKLTGDPAIDNKIAQLLADIEASLDRRDLLDYQPLIATKKIWERLPLKVQLWLEYRDTQILVWGTKSATLENAWRSVLYPAKELSDIQKLTAQQRAQEVRAQLRVMSLADRQQAIKAELKEGEGNNELLLAWLDNPVKLDKVEFDILQNMKQGFDEYLAQTKAVQQYQAWKLCAAMEQKVIQTLSLAQSAVVGWVRGAWTNGGLSSAMQDELLKSEKIRLMLQACSCLTVR
jgi:hypothetical protein